MLALLSILFLSIVRVTYAAFGYTQSSSGYTIDTGSSNSLTFFVNSGSCDVTSILFQGTELQSSTASHIGSGLGTATVSISQSGNYIKVTCVADTLTHYFVVKSGESNIYMATYISAEPSAGELRYIARLSGTALPNEDPFGTVSNTANSDSTVEGSDVFTVDGETRSKFYSSERFIDDLYHCVSSSSQRVCFAFPENAYETSLGGPFFRDINSNNVGDETHLTFYMNSGHVQTESKRMGLYGPYVLTFTTTGYPSTDIDTSFFADLSVTGYVATSGRGYVTGTASGTDSSLETVVHWYNTDAQYWVKTTSGGTFTSPPMKPGTYTMVLYQQELNVAESNVTVNAGSTTSQSISGSWTTGSTIWKIGTWDGQPSGLLNADKQLRMHPSDSRMSSWGPLTFTVGSSADSAFPMALFKDANAPITISFSLTSDQASGAATLRIGTTLSYAGGRPYAVVNSWTSSAPSAPSSIDSRGVTRGAYRGYGEIYDISIASGTLVSGTNTIQLYVASGSSGDGYLSPNIIFDAVELFK